MSGFKSNYWYCIDKDDSLLYFCESLKGNEYVPFIQLIKTALNVCVSGPAHIAEMIAQPENNRELEAVYPTVSQIMY